MPPEQSPEPESSLVPPSASPPARPLLETIFTNDHGLRAGWRFSIYVAVFIALSFAIATVAAFFPQTRGPATVTLLFFQEVGGLIAVFGATAFMARIERRGLGNYGLPLNEFLGSRFGIGIGFGLVEVSALVGSIAAFGGYSFGAIALHGTDIFRWALIWAAFFVLVGLLEEFLFRGYTQATLAEGIGFWPAAIGLSILFGAAHIANKGENWVGILGVVATGVVFAFSLRRTGNLWMAVGWHASFDFGETFLYSVPNSGFTFQGHLSSANLHNGPAWLTGGTAGPEASVFSFVILGILALAVHKLFPARATAVK